VENLASQLGLIAAYWSVSPSLSAQVEKLTIMGKKRLLILPYFLFGGGITDAIAQTVPALQSQFSQVQLSLGQPLGATPKLAEIILRENHAIG
jgi:sirohydrochlorin ferrochelatase